MAQATLVQVDATHARVILTPSYSGADTTAAVLIQRTEDGGITWLDVRGDLADGAVSMLGGTSRQFPDYEVPFDIPVRYRTIKADLDAAPIGSTFNESATVILPSGAECIWWIHSTSEPTTLGGFMPESDGGALLGVDIGINYGNGATYPIVVTGPRQNRSSGQFTLVARTNIEAVEIVAALSAAPPLCVRSPASHGWARRFVAISNISETHPKPVQAGAWLYRVGYVEVQRPTTALEVFGATYDQLALAFATYGDLQAGFGTYDDQTIGLP